MRKRLYTITVLLFIAFFGGNSFGQMNSAVSAQKTKAVLLKKYLNNELKNWASSFSNFKLSEFKVSDTISFENIEDRDFKTLKSFLSIYNPLITFSKNNNQFIDIYSYQLNLEKKGNSYVTNVEIDQAIYLCNLKTKYWRRIFFGGYSLWVDDIIWISNTKFILVGSEKDDDNKNTPKIYLGDTIKQSFEVFEDGNTTCIQSKGYKSQKLKNLNIKEL
jgi:hypothetical protein